MLTPPPSPPPALNVPLPPATFPCSQKYTPDWPLPLHPRNIASWGARVGTRRWISAAETGDFGTMPAALAPAVLDAGLESMYDARRPSRAGVRSAASGARTQSRVTRRSFQEWLDLTTQIVREVYAAALSALPPEYQAQAPALPRVGVLCRNTMNAVWSPTLDSSYYPGSYEKMRPIPLEELGICDPTTDDNFAEVRLWAMQAYGWTEPPPLEIPAPEYPVEIIEVDEDEYDAKLAELQEEARRSWAAVESGMSSVRNEMH